MDSERGYVTGTESAPTPRSNVSCVMCDISNECISPRSPYCKLYPMTPPVLYTGIAAPIGIIVAIVVVGLPSTSYDPSIPLTFKSILAG